MIDNGYEMLDAVLDRYGAESAWFASPAGFGWLAGGDNTTSVTAEVGHAAIGYDGSEFVLVSDHVDRERITEVELSVDADVYTYDWYERSLASVVSEVAPRPAVADFHVPGVESVVMPWQRMPLRGDERERYRALCRDAAAAVERVASQTTPVTAERSAAADIARQLRKRSVVPYVIAVGGEDRSRRYRHCTPTDRPLGGYGQFTVVGRREGLHACLTRTVAFDPPPWFDDRHTAAARVAATAIRATQRAGRTDTTAGRVFTALEDAYANVGHAEEWHTSRQGGATGYEEREWLGRPASDQPVVTPKAYAWNPTIRGVRSEDTVLVTDDDVDLFTATGEWPTTERDPVDGSRPVPQHDILHK